MPDFVNVNSRPGAALASPGYSYAFLLLKGLLNVTQSHQHSAIANDKRYMYV